MKERKVTAEATARSDITIVERLNHAEFQQFQNEFRSRSFAHDFLITNVELIEGVEYYTVAVEPNHLAEIVAAIGDVMERVRPVALRVAEFENHLVLIVNEMAEKENYQWSREDDSPLYRLCIRWAHDGIYCFLRRFDLERKIDYWIDDFHPSLAFAMRENGFHMYGECSCGRGSDLSNCGGQFELTTYLNESRTKIQSFELKFGNAFEITKQRVIAVDSPEIMIDQVDNYRVLIQKAWRETYPGELTRWAFQISKISASQAKAVND